MRRRLVGFTRFLCCCLAWTGAVRAQEKVTYDDQLQRLLVQHCGKCHGAERQRAGLDLSTYAGVLKGSSGGAVVEAGDPDSSVLYLAITHQREPTMPPGSGKLADKVVESIRAWISGGLLENSGSQAKAKKKSSLAPIAAGAVGRPAEPLPIAEHLSIEPVVLTPRPGALGALAANPWAPLLALGGQKQVVLYDAKTFEPRGVLPFPDGSPRSLAFSSDGRLLIAGGGHDGASGHAVVWNVADGAVVAEAGDEPDVLLGADLSADRARIAFGGPQRVVKIVDAATGAPLHVLKKHTEWVTAVRFSPDGVLLASGDRNGGLAVFESETGREMHSLLGHTAAITALAWRDDSNVLVSASEDGTVKLWEMFEGKALRSIAAHGGGVLAVAMAHDGQIASGGRDRAAKAWNADGQLLKSFELPAAVLGVAFDDEGTRLFAGDARGEVGVWQLVDGVRMATLALNPPPIAERIALAEAAVAQATERQAATERAAAEAVAAIEAPRQAIVAAREAESAALAAAAPTAIALDAAQHASQESATALVAVDLALAEARAAQQSRAEAMQTAGATEAAARGALEPTRQAMEQQALLATRLDESAALAAAQSAAAGDDATWREAAARATEAATLARTAAKAAGERHTAAESALASAGAEVARLAAASAAGGDALAAAEALQVAAATSVTTRAAEWSAAQAAAASPQTVLLEARARLIATIEAAAPLEVAIAARQAETAATRAAATSAARRLERWLAADLDRALDVLARERQLVVERREVAAASVAESDLAVEKAASEVAAIDDRQAHVPERVAARRGESEAAKALEEERRAAVWDAVAVEEGKARVRRDLARQADALSAESAAQLPEAPLAQAAAKLREVLAALDADLSAAHVMVEAAQLTVVDQMAGNAALFQRHDVEARDEAELPAKVEALRAQRLAAEARRDSAHAALAAVELELAAIEARSVALTADRDRHWAAAHT